MAFCNMMVRPTSMYRRCPFELALSDACCSRNRPGCDYISYISCIRLKINPPTMHFWAGGGGNLLWRFGRNLHRHAKRWAYQSSKTILHLANPDLWKTKNNLLRRIISLFSPCCCVHLCGQVFLTLHDARDKHLLQTGLLLSFACCACTNRWVIAPYGSLSPCTHLEMYVHINIWIMPDIMIQYIQAWI